MTKLYILETNPNPRHKLQDRLSILGLVGNYNMEQSLLVPTFGLQVTLSTTTKTPARCCGYC